MLAGLVHVGEETAELNAVPLHVANPYERGGEAGVETKTTLLEPLLIVVIGLVLGGILVALYLPMFDLVHAVK